MYIRFFLRIQKFIDFPIKNKSLFENSSFIKLITCD